MKCRVMGTKPSVVMTHRHSPVALGQVKTSLVVEAATGRPNGVRERGVPYTCCTNGNSAGSDSWGFPGNGQVLDPAWGIRPGRQVVS
jgi:hypothetical protein